MGVGGAEWSMRRGVREGGGGSTGLRRAGGCSPARVWRARGPAPCSLPANARYTGAETAPALPEEGSTRERNTDRERDRMIGEDDRHQTKINAKKTEYINAK